MGGKSVPVVSVQVGTADKGPIEELCGRSALQACLKAVLSASTFQSTALTYNIFNLNKSDSVKRKMLHTQCITKESKVISCCVKMASGIMQCFYRQVIYCKVGENTCVSSTKRSCAINCV